MNAIMATSEAPVATVMGPFQGETVYDALAQSMVQMGVGDVAATLAEMAPDVWAVSASRLDGGGVRALLLRADDGWVVAVGDGTQTDDELLAMTRTVLTRLREETDDDDGSPSAENTSN